MLQVCDVLAYLHEQQPPIVHRDLKPANILLDEHDRVMLVDFGIAKASFGAGSTRTVARAVTHGFSPPEQILGPGTDARSDIYALGATMYVLSSGTVPPPAHERVTGSTLVPPRTLRADIPPQLERLILWCVELRPEERPQSIEQVRAVLSGQPCDVARAEPAILTEAVTVPVVPPLEPMADAGSSAATPPTRPTLPSWGRSATTATALLGLGTAVALLQPWRAALWRHERGGPVPDADRPTTSVTLARERVATPAPSLAEGAPSPPTPSTTLPEPLESRIRRALGSDEFAEVTIEVSGDHIVLGRLQSEGQAQHARQLLASLGLEKPIDTDVLIAPQPKPSTDPGVRSAPRPARSPPAYTPRHPAERPRQQAARPSRPARHQPVERTSPPANWVLIPQPARRTD
jgi:serine/threonine-protein kinase